MNRGLDSEEHGQEEADGQRHCDVVIVRVVTKHLRNGACSYVSINSVL